MPNELSEKVYPDGTVVKLRDDTAREMMSYSKQTFTTTSYPLLNSDLVIIRFGKVVSILFRGFKNLTANTENTIINALPSEFRPSETVHCALLQGSSSFAMIRVIILSNGAIKVYPYGDAAVSGAGNMQGTFTYVI